MRIRSGAAIAGGCVLFFWCVLPVRPHDIVTTKLTWTQEISRIVYKRCAGCHHAGGSAMSFTAYDDARPWAKAIRDEVLARRMPPWGTVQGVGDFVGDPSLSQPEIDMLVAWVEGGAPEGEAAYLPPRLPQFAQALPYDRRHLRTLSIAGDTVLTTTSRLAALRPRDLADGASLEAWAIKPDRAVERLIWLRDYRKAWERDYVFRVPVILPAGTHIQTTGPLILRFR